MRWKQKTLLCILASFSMCAGCRRDPPLPPSYAEQRLTEMELENQPPPSALCNWGFPTDQTNLISPDATDVFQKTASGRSISGMYGSVRTFSGPKGLYASFHEGVDIAAVSRDKRGKPLDQIRAIAPGSVLYANKIYGNSNYGNYVVLMHQDPIGSFYTLYAHMASVDAKIMPGVSVECGDLLGIMGNTPPSDIPLVRAHLHFEIGLMLNSRFDKWYRARHRIADHGLGHGLNLAGLDPIDILAKAAESPSFTLLEYVNGLPAAYAVLFKTEHLPDFFKRYPGLWIGEPPSKHAVLRLAVSEGGVPLRGRLATSEEAELIGKAQTLVTDVNEDVLGRNGRRLILRHAEKWTLSRAGEDWLFIMRY